MAVNSILFEFIKLFKAFQEIALKLTLGQKVGILSYTNHPLQIITTTNNTYISLFATDAV